MIKYFEIRDRGTLIPVVSVLLNSTQANRRALLERGGYNPSGTSVMLLKLSEGVSCIDPFEWPRMNGRTMKEAHLYIEKHFDTLTDSQVIDVEFILGETNKPKTSEM